MTSANPEPRVTGRKREKVIGYLKAANEFRQSYQSQIRDRWQESDYEGGMPGAFPDADIVRSGEEEMLLFPSYARKHRKLTHLDNGPRRTAPPGLTEHIDQQDAGDQDYWRREWQRYEDENAVVDVDVRGWIYSPQKGPMNRKNRLLLAVARRLSGIPAIESSPNHSRDPSTSETLRSRMQEDILSHEEEAAAREAEILERHGRKEAAAAVKGEYSSEAAFLTDETPPQSRSNSPRPSLNRVSTTDSFGMENKRLSQNVQNMSREEIVTANEQLLARLKPFMTVPLASTPISILFYNDEKSTSKSVYTDESGHFKIRAALDFVPNKVRVLASETLSATEDVTITEVKGISIISDIDDTIKHSSIASGAKEIFKNTFIRDLGELSIPGVREWYTHMSELGVKMHYVSNSPWQLYPVLRSYFAVAGLPHGSYHLKQYSGMLQGIFEPAAERKKGSLDRIMYDFPERKFILIGDSGEADLEVYTDIVQEHPGRVLGVFIRDVTSKPKRTEDDFSSSRPLAHSRQGSNSNLRDEFRPALPERPRSMLAHQEDLIDFSDDSDQPAGISHSSDLEGLSARSRPNRPPKPSALRSSTTQTTSQTNSSQSSASIDSRSRPEPPAPRRVQSAQTLKNGNSLQRVKPPAPPPSRPRHARNDSYQSQASTSTQDEGYLAAARQQLSNAYNALPTIRPQSAQPGSGPDFTAPPRRGLTSIPSAAAKWVTGASGGDPAAGGDGGAYGAPYDKKLEIWKRRWARSEDIMRQNRVVLRTWRRGEDVMGECARLVEKGLNDLENGRN